MIKPTYIYDAYIKRVIDGDTFEAAIDLGFYTLTVTHLRLGGIDTPEVRTLNRVEKAHGLAAKQFVIDQIEGKNVVVSSVKRGKYRFVADIFYENPLGDGQISLRDALLAGGFAKRLSY